MADGRYSSIGLIKNFLIGLLVCIIFILAMPVANVIFDTIDNRIVNSLLQNMVDEGRRDKLYGEDQIYSYLQKGLDENNVKMKARDIIKASNAGGYVVLTLDYRKDNKVFSNLYLSTVYHQTYRVNLK